MFIKPSYPVFRLIDVSPCYVKHVGQRYHPCGRKQHIPTSPVVGLRAASTLFPVAVNIRLVFVPGTEWKIGSVAVVPTSGTPTSSLCQSITPASDSWRAFEGFTSSSRTSREAQTNLRPWLRNHIDRDVEDEDEERVQFISHGQ